MIRCTCSADRLQPGRGGRGQGPSRRLGSANASSQPTVYEESDNLRAAAEVDNQAPTPAHRGRRRLRRCIRRRVVCWATSNSSESKFSRSAPLRTDECCRSVRSHGPLTAGHTSGGRVPFVAFSPIQTRELLSRYRSSSCGDVAGDADMARRTNVGPPASRRSMHNGAERRARHALRACRAPARQRSRVQVEPRPQSSRRRTEALRGRSTTTSRLRGCHPCCRVPRPATPSLTATLASYVMSSGASPVLATDRLRPPRVCAGCRAVAGCPTRRDAGRGRTRATQDRRTSQPGPIE